MSRSRSMGLLAAFLLALAATAPAAAQDHTPQPYSPDEFQAWMKKAFRAEAVFVGSFPFTLFFTLEAYDTMRYASNGFSPSYAPWPFGSGTAVTYSADETLWLVVSAISLSAVISGIDFLIGRASEGTASEARASEGTASGTPPTEIPPAGTAPSGTPPTAIPPTQ